MGELVLILVGTLCALLSLVNPSPLLPTKTGTSSKFLWFPKDTGTGYVPAILEGGPKVNPKDAYADIRFFLYTGNTANKPFELYINDHFTLLESDFFMYDPVKIVIHGFSSGLDGMPAVVKNGYLNSQSANVIVVDWSVLAAAPWYETAAGHTKLVGDKTAEFIKFLVKEGVSLDRVHVLGHSLGAHVAGFIGAAMPGEIRRITAFDPALPLFGEASDSGRIDPSDARFIDVIHTGAGTLSEGGLAFMDPRGHADFYPNKGENQPGCGADVISACSHGRAHEYFSESISNPQGFRSCKCLSWDAYESGSCACDTTEYMGVSCSTSATGLFYLRTNGEVPFAQG